MGKRVNSIGFVCFDGPTDDEFIKPSSSFQWPKRNGSMLLAWRKSAKKKKKECVKKEKENIERRGKMDSTYCRYYCIFYWWCSKYKRRCDIYMQEVSIFFIPNSMLFVESNDGLCRCIRANTPRIVVLIRYKYLISIFGRFIQYQAILISDNDNIQQIFRIH